MRPVPQPPETVRQRLRDVNHIHVDSEAAVDVPWVNLQHELQIVRDDPAVETIFETEYWEAISVDSSLAKVVYQQAGVDDEEVRRALSFCHTLAMPEWMDYTHGGRPGRDSFIIPA